MTKKIAIVQGILPHYRIPFFQELSKDPKIEISLFHSGDINNENIAFNQVKVKRISFFSFKFQVLPYRTLSSFDTIVFPFDVTWLSMILYCSIHTRRKIIFWGHGLGRLGLGNMVRKYLLKKSKGIILYDSSQSDNLEKYTRKIFIAPNTVHVSNASCSPDQKRTSFLYVGRSQGRKRVEELLEAFSLVRRDIPSNIHIEIVGGADQRLADLVDTYGIQDRVIFHGEITDDHTLKSIFHNALAYISPGHVGLGVLHSFAYGVPVVTRQQADHAPEFHNLVDGKNGILYDGSIPELVKILRKLANTPDYANKLGIEAYEWYRGHRTITHMVDRFREAIT